MKYLTNYKKAPFLTNVRVAAIVDGQVIDGSIVEIYEKESEYDVARNGEAAGQLNLREAAPVCNAHCVDECLLALSKIYQSLREKT